MAVAITVQQIRRARAEREEQPHGDDVAWHKTRVHESVRGFYITFTDCAPPGRFGRASHVASHA